MPITVFDASGVPEHRRESLEQAVEAAGRTARGNHEAWIVPSSARKGFCVRITGPDGFYRQADFGYEQSDAEVSERIRQVLSQG
ncbi:MAG TPA: hypothetical protein VGF59_22050 [Bryobacteraceae bacterium]|jgi:hypothetical protein